MPDYHGEIRLLGVLVPVTVSWYLESKEDGGIIEIEQVTSDTLGDITDRVLCDVCGTGFYPWVVLSPKGVGWVDPIRRALFGHPVAYMKDDPRCRPEALPYEETHWARGKGYMVQHETIVTRFLAHGTLADALRDAIAETTEFAEAMGEPDYCDGTW